MLTLGAIVYLGEAYPHNLIAIYAAIMWAVVARVVRAQIVSLRDLEFVDAARALGATDRRILLRHLLPNAGGTILVAATSLVGQIVLIDATVEFSQLRPAIGDHADARQPRLRRRLDQVRARPRTSTWVAMAGGRGVLE